MKTKKVLTVSIVLFALALAGASFARTGDPVASAPALADHHDGGHVDLTDHHDGGHGGLANHDH